MRKTSWANLGTVNFKDLNLSAGASHMLHACGGTLEAAPTTTHVQLALLHGLVMLLDRVEALQ